MLKGDLILTPSGLWHEHGHEGEGPVIWLDALDLPLIYGMEASYAEEGSSQALSKPIGFGVAQYGAGGLLPYKALNQQRSEYPMLRFPWADVKRSLRQLASVTSPIELVRLAYVNPQTGQECLPTLGFSAVLLRPGQEIQVPRSTASAVLHLVEGSVSITVEDSVHAAEDNDTVSVPTHATVSLANRSNRSEAFLFVIDDAPLQRKLGIFRILD